MRRYDCTSLLSFSEVCLSRTTEWLALSLTIRLLVAIPTMRCARSHGCRGEEAQEGADGVEMRRGDCKGCRRDAVR